MVEKHQVPIANGKVYLATFTNRLDVYGLLPPALSVDVSAPNIVVSWPANNYAGYKLQTTVSLMPSLWLDVTNSVILTNGMLQVTIPPVSVAAFYRLKL